MKPLRIALLVFLALVGLEIGLEIHSTNVWLAEHPEPTSQQYWYEPDVQSQREPIIIGNIVTGKSATCMGYQSCGTNQ